MFKFNCLRLAASENSKYIVGAALSPDPTVTGSIEAVAYIVVVGLRHKVVNQHLQISGPLESCAVRIPRSGAVHGDVGTIRGNIRRDIGNRSPDTGVPQSAVVRTLVRV